MPLTTQDSQRLTANPITDVNANVAVEGRKLSSEAALLFNKSIIARPLMTPEVCSIHVKNTEYRYRWVNRSSSNGQMLAKRRAQGFVNATKDDVDLLSGDATNQDGEITSGDLILMKIRADLYDAAIKYNMVKALTLANMRGVSMEGASTDVMDDDKPRRVSVANEPFVRNGAVKPFIPDNPDSIVEDSISSGRAAKAIEESKARRSAMAEKER